MKKYGGNRDKLEKLEKLLNKKDIQHNQISINQEMDFSNRSKVSVKKSNSYNNNILLDTSNQIQINYFNNYILNQGTNKLFGWLGIPTKFDQMSFYAKWWKFYDNAITCANIFIILLAFYDYELNFSNPRQIVAEYNSIRLLMIAIAFSSIFCVLKRHYMKHKYKNIKLDSGNRIHLNDAYGSGGNMEEIFFEEDRLIGGTNTKFLGTGLYFDIMINLIMPYPRMDFHIKALELDRDLNKLVYVDYLLSDIIYLILLFRCIYILRAFINFSIFSDHYAFQVSKEYKVNNNIRFALKCLLKIHHIKLVMWFFVGSVVIFGFMLRIVERPFWVQKGRIEFDNYGVPMWCIFVTMLTIGFGDFAPLTVWGKFITFIAALWGVFICSLIIVCLHGLLDLSNDQFNVFTKILKSRVAVKFIESAYYFHKNRFLISKKHLLNTKKNYRDLIKLYHTFKNMRNESKSIYRSNGLLHYNMKLLKEMKKLNHRIDKFEIDVDAVKRIV